MLVLWFLNLLGIMIFFMVRYENRRVKDNFKLWFWIRDNWVELCCTLLFNIALMIILLHPEVAVDPHQLIDKYVPFEVKITGFAAKMVISFLLGLGLSAALYSLVKKLKPFNAKK